MNKMAKFLVALAGAVTQVIGQGLINGDAASWASIVAGILTAAAVYAVPNAKEEPADPASPAAPPAA